MGTPKSWKTVELEQQCRFGFTADYIKSKLDDWSVVKDYAFIVHDKDVKKDGSPKEPHIHLMMRFNGACPTANLLAHFDGSVTIDGVVYPTISENNLQKCFRWTSAVAYLTHANASDKYQYDDDAVISNYEWTEDRDKGLSKISDERLKNIIKGIDDETIRPYNKTDYITAEEYVTYKQKIDNAFAYVNDRNIAGRRKSEVNAMKVMFLTGASGTGKTTYAKRFAEDLGLSYYVSSGSNDVLGDYGGQDVIILDDLRPSTLGLADLLKLLDNNTRSTVKSRYYNKCISYCRYIIITTVLPIDTFFSGVFAEENEPVLQLKRRCQTYMNFKPDTISIYLWDDCLREYIYSADIPNVVLMEIREKSKPMTDADRYSIVQDLFKGFKKVAVDAAQGEPTIIQGTFYADDEGFQTNIDDFDVPFCE